jgi:PAS domain S-box-containing protein
LPPQGHWPWLTLVAGLALILLSHPLSWGLPEPGLWFPPAGLALVLVAWLGLRCTLLIAADLFLIQILSGERAIFVAGAEALWTSAEAAAGWWIFHRVASGSRRLEDPHSATLFLVLVPGATAGVFAAFRALAAWSSGGGVEVFGEQLAAQWISRALGVLAVVPPLLVTVTPWLVWHGLIHPESTTRRPARRVSLHFTRGEWVEILGLTLSTALLGVMLAAAHGRGVMAAWHLWGLPLLLIVWASLRRGLHGGVIVAGALAILSLVIASLPANQLPLGAALQTHLLAQCCTALLVGASASWIRASEARYRQVVGHIPVVLYSAQLLRRGGPGIEPLAEITFVSPASSSLLGCAPDDLLGDYHSWLQRVYPADCEILLAAVNQLCLQNQPVTCEYRLAEDDKVARWQGDKVTQREANPAPVTLSPCHLATLSPRWVRDTLAPHRRADGVVDGWEGVVEDITEQRALALDLRRTTNMLHALVANLPAGVFFVQGSHGQPILVNARARQLLGQREDLSGGVSRLSQIYRLYRPDGTLYPAEELPVAQALRLGLTSMRDDIVVHRSDGRKIPLVAWAAPIDLGGQGQPDAAVWVFEDLTALRQAESERLQALEVLRVSEEKYRGLVESLPLMLLQCDQDLRLTYMNPATTAITGFTLEDLRDPDAWQQYIGLEDLSHLRALGEQVRQGHTARAEFRYRAKDGTEKVGYALVQGRFEQGRFAGSTTLIVDMTLQRRLEQELLRVQRLELVGRLASGIAHDFNNLLTVVLTLADVARLQLPQEHPVSDELRRIGEAGEQAVRLAGQLLTFSKQRRPVARYVDLNAVSARALELLRGTLPGSILVEPVYAESPIRVQADELQLQQVLMNLCLNARDAMPEGGRLRVQTEAANAEGWVRLAVSDTGQGMDESVRTRIFEPFFSTKERGTGLGLAVVRQIVENLGGRIEVWSRPGEGTRFDIWLPQG